MAFAKLYDRKTPITAVDLLNDRVVPFYDEHDIRLCRMLTDRGTEYCGNPERHAVASRVSVICSGTAWCASRNRSTNSRSIAALSAARRA